MPVWGAQGCRMEQVSSPSRLPAERVSCKSFTGAAAVHLGLKGHKSSAGRIAGRCHCPQNTDGIERETRGLFTRAELDRPMTVCNRTDARCRVQRSGLSWRELQEQEQGTCEVPGQDPGRAHTHGRTSQRLPAPVKPT